ncbi:hypothetical protein PBY51_008306 [Eleginops maclovinus]|uniref:Uncharacterized protein n=1 Tax=Eleginops maclovinus TaxID=56733 RepID=A0AAN7X703_ELEMC|nr:hypothetical protein PBY51_008306 [Eleginops maclovinus]
MVTFGDHHLLQDLNSWTLICSLGVGKRRRCWRLFPRVKGGKHRKKIQKCTRLHLHTELRLLRETEALSPHRGALLRGSADH